MFKKWFPKIENAKVAKDMTKQGFYGGLFFTAMSLIGLAVIYFTNQSVSERSALNEKDVFNAIIGGSFLIPIQLLLAYRIYKDKGWLASILLFLWLIIEVFFKVLGGTVNPGFLIIYLVIMVWLVNGFRGCWYFRINVKQAAEQDVAQAFAAQERDKKS